MRPRVLFHCPKKVPDHGRLKWRVGVSVRRGNGKWTPSWQQFDTADDAWKFIRESCNDITAVVA